MLKHFHFQVPKNNNKDVKTTSFSTSTSLMDQTKTSQPLFEAKSTKVVEVKNQQEKTEVAMKNYTYVLFIKIKTDN